MFVMIQLFLDCLLWYMKVRMESLVLTAPSQMRVTGSTSDVFVDGELFE